MDEALGLMSAFLLRGASLVLATKWGVDDLCAAEMVVTFLGALMKDGRTPPEALRAAQDRARRITVEDVEGRCRELLERFPASDFPHEATKLKTMAMRACLRGGDVTGARHHARGAASALRGVGREAEADRVEASPNRMHSPTAPSKGMQEPAYDHPAYWSAFQLVGRVT